MSYAEGTFFDFRSKSYQILTSASNPRERGRCGRLTSHELLSKAVKIHHSIYIIHVHHNSLGQVSIGVWRNRNGLQQWLPCIRLGFSGELEAIEKYRRTFETQRLESQGRGMQSDSVENGLEKQSGSTKGLASLKLFALGLVLGPISFAAIVIAIEHWLGEAFVVKRGFSASFAHGCC